MNAPAPTPDAALPVDHPEIKTPKIGVLLVNLGTPDEPTAPAVKRYLREFLSDPRVVELPRALWLPILHGVILNIRPAATAKTYNLIWRTDPPESPLRYFTREQANALATRFDAKRVIVDWAMRYGNPSIADQLQTLREAGCERVLVIPLYPQYSASTTGSVHDAFFDAVKEMRWHPAVRTAPAFHDHPAYIEALAAVTKRRIETLDWSPERVIISFHGIPERYFRNGDPYHCHCHKTARLLRSAIGWTDEFAPLAFQSKFGREKWLEPATTDMIDRLAGEGVKKLAVITPGFTADCIETLEEIAIAGREQFEEQGGELFDAIPCLNAEPEMIDLIEQICRKELAGWID